MTITRKVYIDFDYANGSTFDFSQSYDDITAYAQQINILQDGMATGVANIGTCTITLNNVDKFFTINNTDSPIYGKYRPELPVKIVFIDSTGTSYTRFIGFTENLVMSGEPLATASLNCVNWLGLFQKCLPTVSTMTGLTTDQVIQNIIDMSLNATVGSSYLLVNTTNISDTVTGGFTLDGTTYTISGIAPNGFNNVNPDYGLADTYINQYALDNLAAAINLTDPTGAVNIRYTPDTNTVNTVQAVTPSDQIFRGFTFYAESGEPPATPELITNVAGNAALTYTNPTGRYVAYRTTSANGDTWSVDFTVPITATYQLGANVNISNDSGILEVYLDNVLLTSFDLYNAATAATLKMVSTSITTGVTHTVKYKINGKNASSSSYRFMIRKFQIFTGCITFTSLLSGAVGGSHTISASGFLSTNGTLGSSPFVGTNEPTGYLSLQTGALSIASAGDAWSADTNALSAITDAVTSEPASWLFQQMSGTITFKNKEFLQRINSTTPVNHFNNQANVQGSLNGSDLINRVTLDYTPQSVLSVGVIASSPEVYAVAPRTGGIRVRSSDKVTGANDTYLELDAIDPTTHEVIGIKSIIQPVYATDYQTSHGNSALLGVYAAQNGSKIQIMASSSKNDTIFISHLQVRGIGIVKSQTVTLVRDALTSLTRSIRTLSFRIPFTIALGVARDFVTYTINRYSQKEVKVSQVDLGTNETYNSKYSLALNIGDVVQVSDDQLKLSAVKFVVTGIKHSSPLGGTVSTVLTVEKIPTNTYWLIGNATYGKLGTSTRLGF